MKPSGENLEIDMELLKQRVAQLEGTKADVEMRLRRLERNMYFISGALAFLQVILKVMH